MKADCVVVGASFAGLASVRAGMIPCGGIVHPVAAKRVLLVGDAAGIVYFHRKGVFNPPDRAGSSRANEQVAEDTIPL